MSVSTASSTPARPAAHLREGAISRAARAISRAVIFAVALAALGATTTALAAEPAFLGNWARNDGKTRIRVEPCGAAYCGVNTWVKSGHSGEKVGDTLVASLKPAGSERWSGTAFDRRRNRHYTMLVHVAGRRMTTEGCILGGMMCQSMGWSRLGRAI
jgi:uncharacterized protein (DUF2147 family)